MPFGLIFGAFFFGGLCLLLGWRFLAIDWGPARVTGLLIWCLGVSLAAGLLMRQRWARWCGALAALALSLVALQQAGSVLYNLVFLSALATAALLIVPATGNVQRGLPEGDEVTGRPAGTAAGMVLVATLVGFFATAVWALNAPAPTRPLPQPWKTASVSWSDFGPGIDQAREEQKLLLVDFFATWCQPCHKMDRTTFRHSAVAQILNDEIVAVRVDSEETEERHGFTGEELAERYQVLSYPTVMLLDSEGKLVARRSGYLGPQEFLTWLQKSIQLAKSNQTQRYARLAPPAN